MRKEVSVVVAYADGGGSGAVGPFDHYPASPHAVRAAAEQMSGFAGQVETLQADVTGAHRPAVYGVAGLLADPMVAAERPVRDGAQQWLGSAVFAGAAVRLFADAVQTYNEGIDDLNRRYWEAKANSFGVTRETLPADATEAQRAAAERGHENQVADAGAALLAALRQEWHTRIEPALDTQADQVARLLDAGPGDQAAVVELYAAGALPWTAPVIFRNVDFSSVPVQLPPGVDGGEAADMIRRALDGDASPEEFREAMLLLQMVTDRAEHVQDNGGHLTEREVEFLHDFYNTLGDDIWRVPEYIRADEHSWGAPALNPFDWFDNDAPGFGEDTQEWMLSAMGTGLLALSNTGLWDPSLRGTNPMDPDARYHLPETVIDLVADPAVRSETIQIGGYPYLEIDAPRMDDFRALAQMLGAAPDDVEGGTEFSESLTQRVAELADVAQRIRDSDLNTSGLIPIADDFNDFESVSRTLETLVEVSTRNDEANYNLLTGATDYSMARVWSHVGDSSLTMDDRQFLLHSLYNMEWSDDGAAVAGLTDWIAERADQAAAQNQRDPMATEAAAALIDLVTTTERGEGHSDPDDYRYNMYDDLMSALQQNPEVARSFSGVAASHLDDFSLPSISGETRMEADGSMSISDHDKIRFLDLIATDTRAIDGLSYAAGQYEHRLLIAGLNGDTEMTEVGQRSERLDGLLAAARVNATTVGNSQDFEDAQAAYERHMYYAGLGKTALNLAVGEGLGATPLKPGVPYINAGLGVLADQVIAESIPAPTQDVGSYPGRINDQGHDDAAAAYEYVSALNASDDIPAGQIPDYLLQQAPPYPGAPFESTVYENGRPVLRPLHELTDQQAQDLATFVGGESRGIGGSEYEAFKDNYNPYQNYDQAAAETPDEAQAHREGSDD
jgi:hypothetical protein